MSLATNTSLATCFNEQPVFAPLLPQDLSVCDTVQTLDSLVNMVVSPILSLFFGPKGTLLSLVGGEGLHTANLMYCKNRTLSDALFTSSYERSLSLAFKVGVLTLSFWPTTTKTLKHVMLSQDIPVKASHNPAGGSLVPAPPAPDLSGVFDDAVDLSDMAEAFGVEAVEDAVATVVLPSAAEASANIVAATDPNKVNTAFRTVQTKVAMLETQFHKFPFIGKLVTNIGASLASFLQFQSDIEREDIENWNKLYNQTPLGNETIDNLGNLKILNIGSKTGCNPLLYALGKPDLVSRLEKLGAYLNPLDSQGRSPVHLAVIRQDVPSLKILLSNTDTLLDIRDNDGKTPLFHAVASQNLSMMELLVDAGAKVNMHKGKGSLIHQAFLTDSLDMLEILSKGRDFDVNAPGENNSTVLLFAVGDGNERWVNALKGLGANPDAENYDRVTPRQLAKTGSKNYFND